MLNFTFLGHWFHDSIFQHVVLTLQFWLSPQLKSAKLRSQLKIHVGKCHHIPNLISEMVIVRIVRYFRISVSSLIMLMIMYQRNRSYKRPNTEVLSRILSFNNVERYLTNTKVCIVLTKKGVFPDNSLFSPFWIIFILIVHYDNSLWRRRKKLRSALSPRKFFLALA